VGKWEGRRKLASRPDIPSYVMNSASKVTLYIYENGRFDLGDMSIPKSGKIAIEGSDAKLTIEKIAGVGVERQSQATREGIAPIELTMQPDGSLQYRDPKGMDPSSVNLKRAATVVTDRP
jgi:hypothetical protein